MNIFKYINAKNTILADDLILKTNDLNIKNKRGNNPLISSILANLNSTSAKLIERGIDLNFYNKSKDTAMHYAVKKQNNFILTKLLENKANPNVANIYGLTPLHLTKETLNKESIELLLKHGADKNILDKNQTSPLFGIVQNIPNNINDRNIMAEEYYTDIIKLFVDKHVNIFKENYHKQSIIGILKEKNYDDIINNIVKYYIKKYFTRDTACEDKFKYQVDNLFDFVKLNLFRLVRWIIQNPRYCNVKDSKNRTLLQVALLYKHNELANLILPKIINLDSQDENLETALFYAIRNNDIDIVDKLLELNANPNILNSLNLSPLHYAVSIFNHNNPCYRIIELLILKGANLRPENIQDLSLSIVITYE